LIRADLVRSRDPFYNEANLHADTEACYDLLRSMDFGFVHQVLTYTRTHNEQVSTYAQRNNTYLLGNLHDLQKYGPYYLSASEYEQRLNDKLDGYYRYLAWCVFQRREQRFWDYHRQGLDRLELGFSRVKLAQAVVMFILNRLLNPKQSIEGKINSLKNKRRQTETRRATQTNAPG
jgi:hypothetical protein